MMMYIFFQFYVEEGGIKQIYETAVESVASHACWIETKRDMQMSGCGTGMNETDDSRLYLSKV